MPSSVPPHIHSNLICDMLMARLVHEKKEALKAQHEQEVNDAIEKAFRLGYIKRDADGLYYHDETCRKIDSPNYETETKPKTWLSFMCCRRA